MNEILLEYYQGRPKELVKCEGYIREIIKLIKDDHENASRDLTATRHVYRDAKPCKNLEKELAKFFNVKEINIYWDTGTINAYTVIPLSFLSLKRKNNYLAGKFQDIKIHICIFEELVYTCELNEQEVLAILLHEIGHNFYFCPVTLVSELVSDVITTPTNIIKTFVSKLALKLAAKIDDWVRQEIPVITNVVNVITDVMQNVDSLLRTYGVAMNIINSIIKYKRGDIEKPKTMEIAYKLGKYGDEKGADSFATKYGYGAELISALHKFDNPENLLGTAFLKSLGTFGSVMADLTLLSLDVVSAAKLDPHPSHNQRAQSMLKKLKRDLDKGAFPPGAERDLREEIAKLERAVNTVANTPIDGDTGIRKAWYDILNHITKGHTDIRELLNFYFDPLAF